MAKKSNTLDAKVIQLMADVKKRRKAVGALKKPQWLTSASLSLPGFEARINIQIENDLNMLAIAIGTLTRYHDDMLQHLESAGITPDYKWHNYPIEDWITDLKLRIKTTQVKAEQAKLDKLEATLQPLLSDDQRREMALADVEAALKA